MATAVTLDVEATLQAWDRAHRSWRYLPMNNAWFPLTPESRAVIGGEYAILTGDGRLLHKRRTCCETYTTEIPT